MRLVELIRSAPVNRWRAGFPVILVVLLLGISVAVYFWAGQRAGPAQAGAQTLRVGWYNNEPKIYTDDQGQPAGLFATLLEQMAARENWVLDWQPCVWEACLGALESGALDLMPDVALTTDRANRFRFHEQRVVEAWSQVYTRSGNSFVSIDDLAGQTVAVLSGSSQAAYLEHHFAGRNDRPVLLEQSDFASGFRAVESGAADAVVANNFYGSRHRGDYGLVNTPVTFEFVGLYFALGQTTPMAVLDAIDRHLLAWADDPGSVYYAALNAALAPPERARLPDWLLPLLVATVTLVAVLLLAVLSLRWGIRQRTRQLSAAHARLDHVLTGSPVVLFTRSLPDCELTWVSPNAQNILGVSREALMEPHGRDSLLALEDRNIVAEALHTVRQRGHSTAEYRIYDRNGRQRSIREEQQVWGDGSATGEVVGSWTDITEQQEQAERVRYLTEFDPLTGLANREQFYRRLEHAIGVARRRGMSLIVVFADVDRFRYLNESQGSAVGDQSLVALASRLSGQEATDTTARLGSDDFAFFRFSEAASTDAAVYCRRVLADLREPLDVAGAPVRLTASLGVAVYPRDAAEPEKLVSYSELAMMEAKRRGGDRWYAFEPELSEQVSRAFELERALRLAVSREEMRVLLQPQVNLVTGMLSGAEALVRWQHPDEGLLTPDHFIPLAESLGIVQEIDLWVLESVCGQLSDWDRQGFSLPRVAVNLSALSLDGPTLADRILVILRHWELSPSRIQLEVTESALMRAPGRAMSTLSSLRSAGISIAMDDFGTGYSNLVQLRSLPLDWIKVDQSFVRDLDRSSMNRSIVRAVVSLAEAHGLGLLAEGIEEEQQRNWLREAGCLFGQGYLLSRPVTPAAFYVRWTASEHIS